MARAVDEPDERERRHAALDVRLDLDAARLEADEGERDRACKHASTLAAALQRHCDEREPDARACEPSAQAVRNASIVAVGTILSTRRASFASSVTKASACSCVSATYSAS